MRRKLGFAFCALLCGSLIKGQQANPAPPATQNAGESVYYAGPGVMPPRAVRLGLPEIVSSHCGTVTLSAIVDAKGKAGEIEVVHADNPELGKLVTKLLAKTRFEPGTYNGAPAAVAITATVDMQYCVRHLMKENMALAISVREPSQNEAGFSTSDGPAAIPARTDTIYKIGGPVSPPVVLHSVPAKFSSYARKKKISGSCLIGLIVDSNGMPQKVHVIQSLEPSLDENAMQAIEQYRFKPAMKNGTAAVPVEITVKVDFHLY